MKVIDINDVPAHEPYYMFKDNENGVAFFVSEEHYDEFSSAPNNSVRNRLADVVILLPQRRIVKSRHF